MRSHKADYASCFVPLALPFASCTNLRGRDFLREELEVGVVRECRQSLGKSPCNRTGEGEEKRSEKFSMSEISVSFLSHNEKPNEERERKI